MTPRIGILGTGWGVRAQVPAFRFAGWTVTALWARTAGKARAVAAELSIPFSTADVREVLAREDVDLVSITTPPHLHCEIAEAALAAGKHVVCEKPTALTAAEAARMLAAARAHPDRIALIDHELRFHPERQRMRALLADVYAGEPALASGHFAGSFRLDPDLPWDWWSDAGKGGGTLGAIGSHMVDSLAWLTGRPIAAVCGALGALHGERRDGQGVARPVTADDFATVQLRFAGGGAGLCELSAATAGPSVHRLVVAGTEGSLCWDRDGLTGYRPGADPEDLSIPRSQDLPPRLRDREFPFATVFLARALRAAIEDGDRAALAPAATFEDGLRVQRILDAVRRSHETGAWVEVKN
jgi:predicted dehydrogenase